MVCVSYTVFIWTPVAGHQILLLSTSVFWHHQQLRVACADKLFGEAKPLVEQLLVIFRRLESKSTEWNAVIRTNTVNEILLIFK